MISPPFNLNLKCMSTLLTVIVFAVVIYLVLEYLAPKLPAPIGTVVIIIVVLFAIVWLLSLVFPGLLAGPHTWN
jgi:hypothetical protein